MYEHARQQQQKLYDLAATDMIYQTWQRSFKDCQKSFFRFAASQPDEIRDMLYGYADCGRMAQQRLVNLACEYMQFPDDK